MRVAVVLAVLTAGACSRSSTSERAPGSEPVQPIQITSSMIGAYEAALAARDDGLVAAWYDNRDGNGEIYMRRLDGNGHPAGPERRLTTGPEESYEASIGALGDAVVLAWYDKSSDEVLVPKLGVWELDGRNRWVRTLAARGRNPVVSVRDRDIFCAWIAPDASDDEWVWAGWWALDGSVQVPAQRLALAGKTTWNLNVAAGDRGSAYVVFDAVAGTKSNEIFLVRFTPQGSQVERLTVDDGKASKYPDLAAGDRLALTWFDERDGNTEVYLLTTQDADLHGEVDTRARRVTSTPGESIGAYLRWGDTGTLGLAWSDDTGGQHEVYFQEFDADAAPLGAVQRITHTPTASLIPAVRPWRGGFALAWNEFKPGAEAHAGTSEIWFAIVR